MSKRSLIVWIAVGFFCLGGIALIGTEFLYRWRVAPIWKAQKAIQAKHLPAYLADQSFLRAFTSPPLVDRAPSAPVSERLFAPPDRTSWSEKINVGPALNRAIFWNPPQDAEEGEAEKVTTGLHPIVPLSLREEILRSGADWMRPQMRALQAQVQMDFAVFEKLGDDQYWDIELNSPITRSINADDPVPPVRLPAPDTADLVAAAKVRLLLGVRQKRPLMALRDVRNLSRLLLTTENFRLVQTGIALLDIERTAFQYCVDHGLLPQGKWIPIPPDVTLRANRATWGTRGYLQFWTDPEFLREIFLAENLPFSFCAAVNEKLPEIHARRSLLEPNWPLEIGFAPQFGILDAIFKRARSVCRLRHLTDFVAEGDGDFGLRAPGPPVLNRLPYFRKLFSLQASLLNFGDFQVYERQVYERQTGP